MFSRLRRLHAARAQGDDGIAMILVMGSIVTLTLLMTGAMTYGIQGMKSSRNNQDWQAALAAAQAGVDDYAARLNANQKYAETTDCTNVALKGPKAEGAASCSWNASTPLGWQNVEAGNGQTAQFHYEAYTGKTVSGLKGVRLIVTGKSRNETRTLQVRVAKDPSTKFVYYTDFESVDPANRTSYSPNGATKTQCGSAGTASAKYFWGGRSGCNEIQFAAEDTLDGKVHFNDTPMMNNGTTFTEGYETGDPKCKTGTRSNNWYGCSRTTSSSYSARPNIPSGQYAEYSPPLYLPDTSDELLTQPGCHYTGNTRIKLNTNGTMTVWSKQTTSVEAGCGTPGTAVGQLGHANGATVAQLDYKVLYAKNGTSVSQCSTGEIGDGLPMAGDTNFVGTTNETFYCGYGNLYVEGTATGDIGIGAQNNVIVTGDILLDGVAKGADPTGHAKVALVAANSVVVYHPWIKTTTEECDWVRQGRRNVWVCEDVDTYSEGLPAANRYIYASIQTLQHSFWVQSYDEGTKRGDLVVVGSIAQRWRGIVGTGGSNGTGYIKDYRYDERLSEGPPTGIQDFTNGAWAPTVTGELKPAYTCTSTGCVASS